MVAKDVGISAIITHPIDDVAESLSILNNTSNFSMRSGCVTCSLIFIPDSMSFSWRKNYGLSMNQ